MTDTSTDQAALFVCDMNAIAPANRQRHINIARELFQAAQAIRELPNGYAFRLPDETPLVMKAAEFIANERLCCPFFGFMLEIEPSGGPLWLHLTGPEGVKPFIRAEIGETLNEALAQAIGIRSGPAVVSEVID